MNRLAACLLAACLLAAGVTAAWVVVGDVLAAESTSAVGSGQEGASSPIGREVDFVGDILPILTRHDCNSGGCHAAGGGLGKNGFYLSLFGFEPEKDHGRIAAAARGRYLDFAAPDESLLLQKPSGTLPHGGGVRLRPDSSAYATVRKWIAAGAPLGDPARRALSKIEVEPAVRVVKPGEQVRVRVTAIGTDGTREDVTSLARFESNDDAIARVNKEDPGLVTVGKVPADVAIVVRYRDQCGFLSLTIPRPSATVGAFPPLVNYIDEHVFAKLRQMGLSPSAGADDSAFLRRLYVDVAGRVPTPEEAAAFLDDQAAGKRAALIDRLIQSGDYATNFADKWVVLLRANRDQAGFATTVAMHQWLRQVFSENMPYDRFVRELITATDEHPASGWWLSQTNLANKELVAAERVKDAAEDAAVLFLAQRISCAKCHQHPFDRWSQADYHGFAAFFTQVRVKPTGDSALKRLVHASGPARIPHPSTEELLGPRVLGGPAMDVPADEDPRNRLAAWLTSPDNPAFARAIVNRMWSHFFGRGIVDPEDDMRETNPPSNPALLDALAADFKAHGFDIAHLVRTICNSATYQRSATPEDGNRDDLRNFSRHHPRRLKAEVLFDAIDMLAGTRTRFQGVPAATRSMELPDNGSGTMFLSVFGRLRGDAACECGRNSASANLGQSLQLINGAEILTKLADKSGRASRLAADKTRSLDSRIDELFLAAYARRPTAAESAELRSYLEVRESSVAAFEDVIWVLVNTKEFLFTR